MQAAARLVGTFAAAALVGVVSGAAAVLTHTSWWWLVFALCAGGAAAWAASGAGRVGLALGWGIAVVRASLERPEGDYLVSAEPQGWTFLGCSLVLVVAALLSAALGTRGPDDPRLRGAPS